MFGGSRFVSVVGSYSYRCCFAAVVVVAACDLNSGRVLDVWGSASGGRRRFWEMGFAFRETEAYSATVR